MGDGDGVTVNTCHYKGGSHLDMIHSQCKLIQFRGSGTASFSGFNNQILISKTFPIIAYRITYRFASHFSHSMSAHTITHDSQPA